MARITAPAAVLLLLALTVPVTGHAANPDQVCAKAKLKAAAKKAAAKLKCYAKAAGTGAVVDQECLDKAELKFSTAFTKADDKGGCAATNDAGGIETLVDNCVDAVRTALGSSAQPNSCLKGKLKTAAKKAASKLKCSAKGAVKGLPPDPDCLMKAEDKFAAAWAKLELKGGCLTMNDVDGVETTIDNNCVAPIVAALPVATVTPTPTKTVAPTPTLTAARTATPTPVVCDSTPPTWTTNLATHNSTRANAQPPPNPALSPLCWKNVVSSTAQSWASGCSYGHNPNLTDYGENIYACASTDASCPTNAVNSSVTAWASEAANYDYASNTCSSVCGHYTQIVWRSTTYVGCGVANCTQNSPFGPSFPNWTFVVCDYAPPGNFVGERPY